MKKIKSLFFVISVIFTLAILPSKTIAQVNYESVNIKDGTRYSIKRVKEKIKLFTLSLNSQKKLEYYEKLLDIRLAELKFVVDNKDIANIQVASQRYFTTAGQLTNFILSNNKLSDNKESVKNLFTQHIKHIELMKNSYLDTTAEWRFVRDDINYLIDYSTLLN